MKLKKRILIIEDNLDDEALLMRQLKKAQLESHVRVIHDGEKALAYLNGERNQCEELAAIFLDLKLPGVDGITILKTIRTNDRLRNLAVIVMTSSNVPDEIDQCRKLGVSCFVQKPLNISSFAKAFADTRLSVRESGNSSQVEALAWKNDLRPGSGSGLFKQGVKIDASSGV